MYDRTFGSVLDMCARSHAGETAYIYRDRRVSYAEAFADLRATGRALRALGLKPGDRVAVVMADSPDLVGAMHGVVWAGLTLVPLNARLMLDDHAYMVEDSGARALLFDGAMAARGHEILERVTVDVTISTTEEALPPGGHLLRDLVAAQDGGPGHPDDVDPEAEAWIQYTGGTTGFPKGAIHSHRTILSAMHSCALELDIAPGEIHAHVAPLTHSGLAYFLPVWMRGGTNVILGGFDPQALLDTIERERVTSTLMVPTMLYVILDLPGIRDRDLSSLRTITYGAAPIGRERLEQALDTFGPVFVQVYGQTEAPAQITVLHKRDHVRAKTQPEILSSCGKPVAIADVAVADDGEVVVRGPHITLGYVNKPEETEAAIGSGWLQTGDIGRWDDDGYLHLVDRKKDMIISGGFNVYPKEVEQTLFQHPGVADVAVIGVPDDKWGEAVKAVVVTTRGADTAADDLIAFVKQRKGSTLAPKSVDFVEAIPLTSVGKHDKNALRDRYWATQGRAVN